VCCRAELGGTACVDDTSPSLSFNTDNYNKQLLTPNKQTLALITKTDTEL